MSHDVKNIMVILSSVSGVGKTTITKDTTKIPIFQNFSITHNQKPRSNEVDGVDYVSFLKKNLRA